MTERLEVARGSVLHELESDAFAGADSGSFGAHTFQCDRYFEGVGGGDAVCYDVDFVCFSSDKGENRLEDANVGLDGSVKINNTDRQDRFSCGTDPGKLKGG